MVGHYNERIDFGRFGFSDFFKNVQYNPGILRGHKDRAAVSGCCRNKIRLIVQNQVGEIAHL